MSKGLHIGNKGPGPQLKPATEANSGAVPGYGVWIDINSTEPEYGVRVLVSSNVLGIYSATPPLTLSKHITHWMPLPAAP